MMSSYDDVVANTVIDNNGLLAKKSTWRDVVFQGHGFMLPFASHQITIKVLPSFSRKHDHARPISDPPIQCIVEPQPNLAVFLFYIEKKLFLKKDSHLWHFFCKPDVIGGPHVGQSNDIFAACKRDRCLNIVKFVVKEFRISSSFARFSCDLLGKQVDH